jgi:hypothetical protein
MPRRGVGKTQRRSRRSLPGTVRYGLTTGVDWRRPKNSEHKITKKIKCLSYYLYNLGFLSFLLFIPSALSALRHPRSNFSVVAGLRWVICYFSRQGAKAQKEKTLQTTGFWFQTLASWRLCVRPHQSTRGSSGMPLAMRLMPCLIMCSPKLIRRPSRLSISRR